MKLKKTNEKLNEKKELLTKSPTRVYEGVRMKEVEAENRKLRAQVFVLETSLEQVQRLLEICDGKLTTWVRKHDELLIKYKEQCSKII